MSGQTDGYLDKLREVKTEERMTGGGTDEQMVRQMDGRMVEQRRLWTHDVMVRRIDGQTDEQTNRQTDEWTTPIMD